MILKEFIASIEQAHTHFILIMKRENILTGKSSTCVDTIMDVKNNLHKHFIFSYGKSLLTKEREMIYFVI